MSNPLIRWLDAWLSPLGLLGIIIVAVASALLIGRLTLGPLQKAARRRGQPTQFYLTDFVWLLVQLQAALGLVSAFVARNPTWAFYTILGFLGAALTVMWWAAVRSMSQAGVQGMVRRAVLILVLLPGVEAAMVATMIFWGISLAVGYNELRRALTREDIAIWPLVASGGLLLVSALFAGVLITWLLRRITLWLLAESAAPQDLVEPSA
jgi:hypothetical protein